MSNSNSERPSFLVSYPNCCNLNSRYDQLFDMVNSVAMNFNVEQKVNYKQYLGYSHGSNKVLK